ncbi:DNA-processing protein DprA [Salegentibacter mishustinae]|uniref:DNA-processing protein DprA n=1 Tax=Salegentibacter mishustinae TaxID=270918 RepID=UPI001CE1CF13|nr:DNA-processing protein DprA [Salegentibacter mishustinae]UBZ07000.1 DNA-processing protein DprA [Salegentibacter mishustinae]
MEQNLAYWMALAHAPRLKNKNKNEIIVKLFEEGKTLVDFFHLEPKEWMMNYNLSEKEANILKDAGQSLSNYSFLVEDLINQGYKIIPITSKEYSPTLKKNLGRSYAPPLLYTKGNLQILKEKSIAIVGSRKANNNALKFTDTIAKKASKNFEVVVSGFAKGVDKQALDSALKYKGQSIIVLPQGITTFSSGFKKYFKQIVDGNVLVLSTFFPKAPWSIQLAMGRNPIIYGLASEIYVAESSEKGGTWSGVMDGLKKGRTIFVRQPQPQEKNANKLLIEKGGEAVNQEGNAINFAREEVEQNKVDEIEDSSTEEKIINLLKKGEYNSKEIISRMGIDWTTRKMTSHLKKQENIITITGKPLKFTHKSNLNTPGGQTKMFS